MILIKKSKKKIFKKKKINKILKRYKFFIVSMILIIFTFLGVYLFTKKIIFSKKKQIKKIIFDEKSIKTYNNPLLYKEIIDNISGKNIYLTKLFYLNDLEKSLKKKFPIVKSLDLQWQKQTVIVKINFLKPYLIFFNQKEYIGFLSGKRFIINKTSPWISSDVIINLPNYTSNYNIYLSGFFYKISPKKLKEDIKIINKNLKFQKITYYPGIGISEIKLFSGLKLYINDKKDIKIQLKYFQLLKNNFSGFNKLYYIDLGSQDNMVFGKFK